MYESIKRYEGFRDKAYQDQGGKWTIGYGQTVLNGRPVRAGDTITREQADAAFASQVKPYAERARQIMPAANPQQHEALTSLIYNYGVKSARITALSQLLKTGNMVAVERYWLASNTVGGKPNAGLANRRRQEWGMFNGNRESA